ncbi:hypothetical protein H5410_062054, partial [Solanum commersonii]
PYTRDCCYKTNEGNIANFTQNYKQDGKEAWHFETSYIVDERCSNHITSNEKKAYNLSTWANINATVFVPHHNSRQVQHQNVYHFSSLKNLLFVLQLTASGNYVLEISRDIIYVVCQYEKAHQLSYGESKYQDNKTLELVQLDMFEPFIK